MRQLPALLWSCRPFRLRLGISIAILSGPAVTPKRQERSHQVEAAPENAGFSRCSIICGSKRRQRRYRNEIGRNPMLKFVPAAAAALLITFTPALAATMPQEDKDQVATPATPQADEQTKAAEPQEQASDDDIQVIIMGRGMNVQVPNPYKN